jgi:hypothetical protein
MIVDWALKEWQSAVSALMQGQTVVLLRKGGIKEHRGEFRVAARQVLLLPTFEHQKAQLLKPAFHPLMEPEGQASDGDTICFRSWADITHVLPLTPPEVAYDLLPHLIWNRQFVDDRLQWKPEKPLYCMILRAYRLNSPIQLPHHSGYKGCRSWVELGTSVDVEHSNPILSEVAFQEELKRIFIRLHGQIAV